MKIKMVVTDLDNTLLRHDKTVSKYTVDVFRRIRERGILTAFATARDFRFVMEYITPMNGIESDILIADNGALVRYKGRDLYKKMIPSATVNALMPCFDLVRCVSTENAYYLSGNYSNDHWSLGKNATVITGFSEGMGEDAFYLDGNTGKSPSSLTEGYPDIRTVTYSDVNLITVVHREATKLYAIIAVSSALNIDMNDVAAFGDDFSDVEMLIECGIGIAVANAIVEAKTTADYICDTNDNDGVAKWIEENIL
jgi:hydroxymethylpyrimidine pyrophosphatase-like HAD family hydrolase